MPHRNLPTEFAAQLAPLVMARAGTHTVQLYEEDGFLVEVLARVVTDGIDAGDAVVTILTPDHQREVDARVSRRGLDIAAARDGKRWVALDAVATLADLTHDGKVDERRLTPLVGGSMDRAASATAGGGVRLFGEMVNLLWRRDDRETALAFEALWEIERVRRRGLSVLCAYPLRDFAGEGGTGSYDAVCRHHTHVIPTESYGTLDRRQLGTLAESQTAPAAADAVQAGDGDVDVDVECKLCRRVLLSVPRIGAAEAEILAAHLDTEHPGTLGAGAPMLGEILRPMLVTRR